MKTLLIVSLIALIPSQVLAQTSGSADASGLATPAGQEVNVAVGGYNYEEPRDVDISIHGPKVGGGYSGTMSISEARRWFLQAQARSHLATCCPA